MRLDIPFIPDPGYLDLLLKNEQRIHSFHFALPGIPTYDARAFTPRDTALPEMIQKLNGFPHQKKHILLNGRFQHPDRYFRGEELTALIKALAFWVDNVGVDGIILADMYLLTTLSREAPGLAGSLQAIPSVNCMIDTADKGMSFLELIESTRFRMPEMLILDRSLNRKAGALDHTARALKEYARQANIALLANEGCLYQCPFKQTHNSQTSLTNTGLVRENSYAISRERGCISSFLEHPQAILKSPFIRPEDQQSYAPSADVIKVCGRNMGPEFLIKTVSAYLNESFDGSLLSLLDATEWMTEHYDLPNKLFPDTFLETVTTCSKNCATCRYCHDLFASISRSTLGTIGPRS
jgi:collagenase-like PrtC family protease